MDTVILTDTHSIGNNATDMFEKRNVQFRPFQGVRFVRFLFFSTMACR